MTYAGSVNDTEIRNFGSLHPAIRVVMIQSYPCTSNPPFQAIILILSINYLEQLYDLLPTLI